MTEKITRREWEEMSAYLDGLQNPREKARLQKLLQERPDLRAALTDMRNTRMLLRNQPAIRSPRNFTLTPDMVGARQAKPPRSGIFQSMRLVSALASAVFVLVVLGDVFLGRSLGTAVPMIADTQPMPELAQPVEEAAAEEAPSSALGITEAPLAIQVQKESERVVEAQETPEAGMTMAIPPGADKSFTDVYPPAEEPLAAIAAEQDTSTAQATATATVTLTPEITPEEGLAPSMEREGATPGFWNSWRILEAGLLIVGLCTGLIALYLRQTGRA
ncbi:MAG TPA: hypothetical protein VLA49_14965 [Anaerolineales bacterium]|nr:hypothetical protein [Anaerolineales bacterium]